VQRIVLLGSTGSIGRSALEVVRSYPDQFEVVGLVAHRSVDALMAQIAEFRPRYAALTGLPVAELADRLRGHRATVDRHTEALSAEEATQLPALPEVDAVLAAVVGIAGLRPVEVAVRAGKRILLANKESLVCAGELLAEVASTTGAVFIPVDSEHSAIFQLLQGFPRGDLASVTLSASGGPFLDLPLDALQGVTPEMAVRHPRWSMGAKISVDSATMVNKALEVIEASRLFGLPSRDIQVVIHPESIIHSLVHLADGTQLAHLSVPDMKGPISYAMTYPGTRLPGVMQRLDLASLGALSFRPLDDARFPAVALAKRCLDEGGGMPTVFNSANEAAVGRFLGGNLSFAKIVPSVERSVARFAGARCHTIDDVLALDEEVRRM
jgi:1-deoxy-D-xylulose-5-phosphate reductoisomerase